MPIPETPESAEEKLKTYLRVALDKLSETSGMLLNCAPENQKDDIFRHVEGIVVFWTEVTKYLDGKGTPL